MNKIIKQIIITVSFTAMALHFNVSCKGSNSADLSFSAGGVTFRMVAVKGNTFPEGVDDSGEVTIAYDYLTGETEVTYELWSTVYSWAGANGYSFENPGRQGGDSGSDPVGNDQHPVTTVNWRDCMVWCNALTEFYNEKNKASLDCVYTTGEGVPIRDSRSANGIECDTVTPDETADGFRLLTSDEWELAARYRGKRAPETGNSIDEEVVTTEVSGVTWYWTPGDYASGAEANGLDVPASSAVAWYKENSGLTTHEVGGKAGNALGLYDMSGNVNEWRFDLHPTETTNRIARGGGYAADVSASGETGFLLIGYIPRYIPTNAIASLGFRIGKNP